MTVPITPGVSSPAADERAAARDRDAALVERVRAGDATAFDALVQAYMRQAFQLAYRVVGHREDAEDLVQEAFLAAYQYLDSYDATRPFGPWLMRIVVSPAPSALEESERAEAREQLSRAMDMLSERQRMIVTLFDVDGLTSTEIGEMIDLSPGTVRWHLHEARRTLRSALSRFFKGDV